LTTHEIIDCFEGVAACYDPDEIMIAVTGGEPLLRKDLFLVAERISELGFPWGMVSNGFAMTKETIKKCRHTNMRSVTISVDGEREDHNWLRRNEDSFDRALAAVRSLREEGFLSSLQIATTVSHRIVDRLPAIYDFMAKEPIDEWRLITLFPGGRARNNRDLLLDRDDYRKLYTFVKEVRRSGPALKVTLDEEGYLGCEFEREVRDCFYNCPAGIGVGGILANGDISACPSISRKLVQGNIRRESFLDCWENRFRPFRDRQWMRQGICASCSEWWICKGNSLHLWNFGKNGPEVCHFGCLYGKG
jgi:radical SAM protein with 4Fe4S-binding SPASM domain